MHQVGFIYKTFPPVCRNFEIILENNGISLTRHNRHGSRVRTIAATDIYTVSVRVYFASQCHIIQIPTDALRHVVTKEMSLSDLVSNEVNIYMHIYIYIYIHDAIFFKSCLND